MKLRSASHLLFVLGLLTTASFALTACDDLDTYDDSDAAQQQQQMQPVEPPVAPEEIPPPFDRKTEAWCPGYWSLNKFGQFTWVSGKVVARPSPTAVWSPARWVHHTYGWAFVEGHWQ